MFQRHCTLAILGPALALVLGVLAGPAASGANETKGLKTGEEAILAALEEKTSVEFIDEPLSNVAQYFKEGHRIEIQIDARALEDVSLGTDTPITKSVENVKLRSVLNLILRGLDLAWMITDEVLMITTPEEAELHLTTRAYDVGKLVMVRDPGGKPWADFDFLTAVITGTIEPESWEGVGGPASIEALEYRGAAVVVVRQTLETHERVARLLDDLAKVAEKYGDEVMPTREKRPQQPPKTPPGPSGGMGGMMGMGGSGCRRDIAQTRTAY